MEKKKILAVKKKGSVQWLDKIGILSLFGPMQNTKWLSARLLLFYV